MVWPRLGDFIGGQIWTGRFVVEEMNILSRLTKYEKVLVFLFALTLPLTNPWVRGDGVGYYAFARSLLIEHRLDFTKDWSVANTSFRLGRTGPTGQIAPEEYTSTGHLNNHFSVGPAILWSPFLIAAHLGVLAFDSLGGQTSRDGYSKPYLAAMGFGTALYGFLALFISFRLAGKYVPERWAFLAAVGIWFGSSLPVYMYFNPSWSHAHSALGVALFVWYWERTRNGRTWRQNLILGAIGGLMVDVYYLNAVVLLLPALDVLAGYRKERPRRSFAEIVGPALLGNITFAAAAFAAFVPTLIAKKIIYGRYFDFGYTEHWYWGSPALLKVCFSADHGIFTWTPILIFAVIGLLFFYKSEREFALGAIAVFCIYLYAVGCYENWHGLASFGGRFFVSLTPFFVVGLAAFFNALERALQERSAVLWCGSATALLIVWNLGLIFQWGMHLIPARGPISWRQAAHNQFTVVPVQAASTLEVYLMRRRKLMDQIEREDVHQLDESSPPEGAERAQ